MLDRFLDPKVLTSISSLELVSKTVVDGFISGLHRSPDFGFSQEFAEYRAYTPGDDLRSLDWNVYARTERMYLKRYRGETNTRLTLMLDASNSLRMGSRGVSKIDYARFLAASLTSLANHQRDAVGMIVFDDEIRQYVPPSSRQGQFHRILHAIEKAEPAKRTDFAKPFLHFQQFQQRRGIAVVMSDFYENPDVIISCIEPLRFHGTEVILFHILDPEEIRPTIKEPSVLIDLETDDAMEVTPDYVKNEYPQKIDGHVDAIKTKARAAGLDYFLLNTSRPLDDALREYLMIRLGRM